MRQHWTIDCETDPFAAGRIPKPFIWGIFTGREFIKRTKISDALETLSQNKVICYAHNGGKFDYHYMLDKLEPFERVTIINGRLAKFKIGECEFRDSWNILPVPLSKYQKTEIDYSIFEAEVRNKNGNMKKIVEYLKDDCIFLHEFVQAFLDEHGVHLTQASAALKAWEKQTGLKAPSTDAEYYDQWAPYYYGGRVQCFQRGIIKKKFRVIDINSAYPRAMLEHHPFGTVVESVEGSKAAKAKIHGNHFYRVLARSMGAFPYRDPDTKKLSFPSDYEKRVFTITGWELLAAIKTETDGMHKILGHHWTNDYINFRQFIMGAWNSRREAQAAGEKAKDILEKLKMNSLYGRFAINPRNHGEFTIYPPEMMDSIDNEETGETYAGFIGPWALGEKPIPEERQKFLNICTSASITGYVRALLWESICKCKGVLYCDTDSLAVESADGLEYGKELGQWKDEGQFVKAYIGGKKLYAFQPAKRGDKWKLASKGVRLEWKDIAKIAKGGTVEHIPDVPTYSVHREIDFVNRKIKATF